MAKSKLLIGSKVAIVWGGGVGTVESIKDDYIKIKGVIKPFHYSSVKQVR